MLRQTLLEGATEINVRATALWYCRRGERLDSIQIQGKVGIYNQGVQKEVSRQKITEETAGVREHSG